MKVTLISFEALKRTGPIDLGSAESREPTGVLVTRDVPARPGERTVRRVTRIDCVHCVGPFDPPGNTVLVKGCGGCAQKVTTIFKCDLHEDCAPMVRSDAILEDEKVTVCMRCSDYESRDSGDS